MSARLVFRRIGNTVLKSVPQNVLRMLLKGFSDQPTLAEACGFQVLPKVFYSPVPDPAEIDISALHARRNLPGIDLRLPEAVQLTRELANSFGAEIAAVPRKYSPGTLLWLENYTYADFDAATLYAMLRRLKPKRYIEVGCGFSSRASTLALRRNAEEGVSTEAHYIEPFPSEQFLELALPGTFHRKRIQEIPQDFFTTLGDGDVLFIDTSHVLKTQSDVEYELVQILPKLAPGVWVHVHDIFTPYDYPEEWVMGVPRAGNNEQYALECLLSGGKRFQVELPVHALWREHRDELDRLCQNTVDRPAAFWIRRTAER